MAKKPAKPAKATAIQGTTEPTYGQSRGPAPEIVKVRSHRVACEGVGGALGHPRVWLEIGASHYVDCGYCDRRFVLSHNEIPEDERLAPGVYEGAAGH